MLFKKFIIYDYETYGLNVSLDKVSQFSCLEIDSNFNIIKSPISIFCYPPLDYIPDVFSIFITKILPQYAYFYGVNEYFLAKIIYKIFTQKNICILGYNNISFDNLITRNIFYRNFLDPYEWEWKHGNSVGDILQILRTFYILEPSCLLWPRNILGNISFRLSDITQLNKIPHLSVHNALSDVLATFSIFKILNSHNQYLLHSILNLYNKKKLWNFFLKNKNKPFFYISNVFGSQNNNIGVVCFLMIHPLNKNIILVYNLQYNPQYLFIFLKQYLHTKEVFKNLFKLGVFSISLNKKPIVLSYKKITTSNCIRLKLNYLLFQKNFFILKKKNIILILKKIFTQKIIFKNFKNVDLKLYDNFFNSFDKKILENFFKICSYQIPGEKFNKKFQDSRLSELFFRMRARNFSNTLLEVEKNKWRKHCQFFLKDFDFLKFFNNIEMLEIKYKNNPQKYKLIKKILFYVQKKIFLIQNL
ncbi:exodeoxyribonuclease I [Buchnera aphidicola]|uniref:exodeoxyribonuclease I n=1 Tax=Buchnera aphidicola TaxID=9 RepID=UPI0031B81DF3